MLCFPITQNPQNYKNEKPRVTLLTEIMVEKEKNIRAI